MRAPKAAPTPIPAFAPVEKPVDEEFVATGRIEVGEVFVGTWAKEVGPELGVEL